MTRNGSSRDTDQSISKNTIKASIFNKITIIIVLNHNLRLM